MPRETCVKWKTTDGKTQILDLDTNGKTAYVHSQFLKPDALRELAQACMEAAAMIDGGFCDVIPCFNTTPNDFGVQTIKVDPVPQPNPNWHPAPTVEQVQQFSAMANQVMEGNDEPLDPVAGSNNINPVFARKARERVPAKSRRHLAPVQPGGNGYQATAELR